MADQNLNLSNDKLDYQMVGGDGLKTIQYGRQKGRSWANIQNPGFEFAITVDDDVINGTSQGMTFEAINSKEIEGGARHFTVQLIYPKKGLNIQCHTITYPESTLIEKWVDVSNVGSQPVRIQRLDSFSMHIPDDQYELMYYTSSWGKEFEGITEPLLGARILETRKGRSSNEQHPWMTLTGDNGELLTASVMWSGNWIFRFEPLNDGGYAFSGGLNDWEFYKDLNPYEKIEGLHVAFALGSHRDLNETSIQFTRIGREYWYPHNSFSRSLPTEWNHWWSYEDKDINETTFKKNVDEAAKLGIDVCTLDAGWFGPTDSSTHWYNYRGDWNLVNTVRFPNGIREISDYVHKKGMKFGLWCEIEAIGKDAQLANLHPEFVALRDDEHLGYVCFGSPKVQEWAFDTLDQLIRGYRCDWIKLDFNLDPGAGCNRTDHGHGGGDGLYEHYCGYYRVLSRIREKHPEVILENCSSGGLRTDLGMMRQTHTTFLSDPDWPEHDLQLFWGASTMLAPNVCLHWGFGEWMADHPYQTFNPRDPDLKQHQLDYYVRISMLNGFGFSQKLPELPGWVTKRFCEHIRMYREEVRHFVNSGDLYRLTNQPRRGGKGDRWAGLQYRLENDEHLCFVFRLHGGEGERIFYFKNLLTEKMYTITWMMENQMVRKTGQELMEIGLAFSELKEEDSAIMHIQ